MSFLGDIVHGVENVVNTVASVVNTAVSFLGQITNFFTNSLFDSVMDSDPILSKYKKEIMEGKMTPEKAAERLLEEARVSDAARTALLKIQATQTIQKQQAAAKENQKESATS